MPDYLFLADEYSGQFVGYLGDFVALGIGAYAVAWMLGHVFNFVIDMLKF